MIAVLLLPLLAWSYIHQFGSVLFDGSTSVDSTDPFKVNGLMLVGTDDRKANLTYTYTVSYGDEESPTGDLNFNMDYLDTTKVSTVFVLVPDGHTLGPPARRQIEFGDEGLLLWSVTANRTLHQPKRGFHDSYGFGVTVQIPQTAVTPTGPDATMTLVRANPGTFHSAQGVGKPLFDRMFGLNWSKAVDYVVHARANDLKVLGPQGDKVILNDDHNYAAERVVGGSQSAVEVEVTNVSTGQIAQAIMTLGGPLFALLLLPSLSCCRILLSRWRRVSHLKLIGSDVLLVRAPVLGAREIRLDTGIGSVRGAQVQPAVRQRPRRDRRRASS